MSSTTWQFEANFDGVAARNGAASVTPATGAYEVTISEAAGYEKDGAINSVCFKTFVNEGEFKGAEVRIFIGTDLSKAGNQRSWKTALLSCGLNPQGKVSFAESTFKGKKAYVYFKAKDADNETSQPEKYFITPEAFTSLQGNAVSNSAVGGSSVPQVSVQKPAGGGVRSLLA